MTAHEIEKSPRDEDSTPPSGGRFEFFISTILRIGVTASTLTIALGLVMTFARHPAYLRAGDDLVRLTSPGVAFPHSLGDVAAGLKAARGQAIVAAGLLLLIATPILRVVVSIVIFALQRDRLYIVITSMVLAALLASFLLGKVE